MAMRNGWKCHIVYHGKRSEFKSGKGNSGFVKMSGATVEFVEVSHISEAMDVAMKHFEQMGLKPYYIHGGGHDIPGATCFVEAIRELKCQCESMNWKPDYIFHASGTGGTQAGLAVGLDMSDWSDVKLIGISVAREQVRGKQIIVNFANELSRHYGNEKDYSNEIIFNTDYLGEGYDKKSRELKRYLKQVYCQTGLMLDETYSGKAVYGMMQEIKKLGLQDKKIVFWMTGGPLNFV